MNTTIGFDQLCIEITRKCNMKCDHCLRGDAQNIDMPIPILENFLSKVSGINCLTITGGEPSLNIQGMEQLLRLLKKYRVNVNAFYLVTNGKKITNRFLKILMDFLLYCDCDFDEASWSAIALSQDKFHEEIPEENIRKLSLLRIFNSGDKKVDWDKVPLVESGRAVNLVSDYKTRENYMNIPDIYLPRAGEISVSETTTLTCDGDLISTCDYAYDQLNELKNSPYFIENVNSEDWVDKIKKKFC